MLPPRRTRSVGHAGRLTQARLRPRLPVPIRMSHTTPLTQNELSYAALYAEHGSAQASQPANDPSPNTEIGAHVSRYSPMRARCTRAARACEPRGSECVTSESDNTGVRVRALNSLYSALLSSISIRSSDVAADRQSPPSQPNSPTVDECVPRAE